MLRYLHQEKIVYRDLKPENLLIDKTGYLKLIDYTFAKKISDWTFTLCGTPEYIAPEIIKNEGHGLAVDWWCLGIMIFEMLVGITPFYGDNPKDIFSNILKGKVYFPSDINKSAKSLIKHLLTADLSKRYGNLKNGYLDIMKHWLFKDLDFSKLENRLLKSCYIPVIMSEHDFSNFKTNIKEKEFQGS